MAVKAAAGRAPVRGRSGLGIGARRSGGEAVGGEDAGTPFYRVGAGAGQPGDGGEWAVAMVRHDGGGGGRLRRGSTRAMVGSDEGAASAISGVKGGREAARACTREAAMAAAAIRPGEEVDWAGPTCRRERAGWAGWPGQRPRPSGGW
jgi:hypothetical protein